MHIAEQANLYKYCYISIIIVNTSSHTIAVIPERNRWQIGATIGATIGAKLVAKMGVNYKGVSETPLFMAYLYAREHVMGLGI